MAQAIDELADEQRGVAGGRLNAGQQVFDVLPARRGGACGQVGDQAAQPKRFLPRRPRLLGQLQGEVVILGQQGTHEQAVPLPRRQGRGVCLSGSLKKTASPKK